jgi:signal-transduction protein with cAMP-binding, CBS, and nucleotidyltransferase domain
MPSALKEDLMFFQYGTIIRTMTLFQHFNNYKFIWDILQNLNKSVFYKDTEIYKDGDLSDTMYFIQTGQVNLLNEKGYTFHSFKVGENFGNPEMVCGSIRCGTAIPLDECLIFFIKKFHLD